LGNNQIAISYTTINSDGFMIEDITTIDLNTGDTEEKREYMRKEEALLLRL
jgi:hypothetical protein